MKIVNFDTRLLPILSLFWYSNSWTAPVQSFAFNPTSFSNGMLSTAIHTRQTIISNNKQCSITSLSSTVNKNTVSTFMSAETEQEQKSDDTLDSDVQGDTISRVLGSQELLMLPRQYSLSKSTFPPMSHVTTALLSATPSTTNLKKAIYNALQCHPLLRSTIIGDGEPTKRIDLFNMVREGEPNPETFCSSTLQNDDESIVTKNEMLRVTNVKDSNDLTTEWQTNFRYLLDHGPFSKNFMWSIHLHRIGKEESNESNENECALTLVFNHAISDQSSANLLFDHILTFLEQEENSKKNNIPPVKVVTDIPPSLEESILGSEKVFQKARFDGGIVSPGVFKYVAGKAAEGFRNPVILPDDFEQKDDNPILNAITTITGRAAGGATKVTTQPNENDIEAAPEAGGRYSTTQFRTLSKEDTTELLNACRMKGVTISNALTAAAAITASNFIQGKDVLKQNEMETDEQSSVVNGSKTRNYKVLQSLDMRRFHKADSCRTPSCHASSMDLMLGPISDQSDSKPFWDLALESNKQTKDFIDSNGPENAVRVFDFAMQISDMNNLVHLTAISEASQGRAYSAGITNAGVYEKQKGVEREGVTRREYLKSREDKYKIQNLYYATSHARSGCLYQCSSLTINGEMQFTFHPAAPIVSSEVNEAFADSFIQTLKEGTASASKDKVSSALKASVGPILALSAIFGSVAIHGDAWVDFIQNIMIMKENASPEDFSAALNFWIFFAVGHPILQPILWISDVLHGSPGPLVGGLVPLSFLIGNVVVLGLLSFSKEVCVCVCMCVCVCIHITIKSNG